jgi:hypothetical protein
MKIRHLIATMVMAAAIMGPVGAGAEDIALSLVNPKGRVDIPVSAIHRVDALATFAFRIKGTDEVREYASPRVEVCFAKDIRERMCQLTERIIGEPLAIVIDCDIVSKPIVQESLCEYPCFEISANDIAEANALAQRISKGTNRACAPSF